MNRSCIAILTTFLILSLVPTATWAGPPSNAKVTQDNVNVHQGPDGDSQPFVRLYRGREVTTMASRNGWVQVRFEVTKGEDTIAMSGWLPQSVIRQTGADENPFEDETKPVEAADGGAMDDMLAESAEGGDTGWGLASADVSGFGAGADGGFGDGFGEGFDSGGTGGSDTSGFPSESAFSASSSSKEENDLLEAVPGSAEWYDDEEVAFE